MNTSLTKSAIGLALVCLYSCMPVDTPIEPVPRGESRQEMVSIGAMYQHQQWFSLNNGIVGSQHITSWHLGFQGSGDEFAIILNTALFMRSFAVSDTSFEAVTSLPSGSAGWRFEPLFINIDSTSLGIWYEESSHSDGEAYVRKTAKKTVYVVDLGFDEEGRHLGNRKMEVLGFSQGKYTLRVAELSGRGDTTFSIERNLKRDFSLVALAGNTPFEVIDTPLENEWDFFFTRYTFLFYVPEQTPYSVTGVAINPARIEGTLDSTTAFQDIDRDFAASLTFSRSKDIIGYNWKWFSLQENIFFIRENYTYILRNKEGFFYKLRFIDFYNERGERGSMAFEVQRL